MSEFTGIVGAIDADAAWKLLTPGPVEQAEVDEVTLQLVMARSGYRAAPVANAPIDGLVTKGIQALSLACPEEVLSGSPQGP